MRARLRLFSSHAPLSQPEKFPSCMDRQRWRPRPRWAQSASSTKSPPVLQIVRGYFYSPSPSYTQSTRDSPDIVVPHIVAGGQCIKSPQREREYIITRPQHRDNAKLYSKCYVAISIPDIFHPLLEAFSAKRSPYFAASAKAPSGFVEDHEDISRLLKPFVHTPC